MKHAFFLVLLFIFFPVTVLHSSSPSISISQSIASTGSNSGVFSLHSPLFDGRIGTSIPDFSASLIPEITTFAVSIHLGPYVSFFAGSLSFEGLPSRTRKLAFALSTPFHSPLTISSSNTVATASATETKNGAFEFKTDTVDAVIYSSRLQGIDKPTWALVSKTFYSSTADDDALKLSFFTGTKKLIPSTETSWFCEKPGLPETDVSISSTELIFHKGIFGGSVTGLMDIGRFRKPAGSFRTEGYIDQAPFLLSAGYFYSERQFVSLDGNDTTLLSRFFFAPLFYAKPSFLANSRISWGAIFYADSSVNPDFTGNNIQTLHGGTGIRIDSTTVGFLAQGMIVDDELDSECAVQLKNLVPKKLRASISGKASLIAPIDTGIKAKSEAIQSSVTFNPFSILKIEAKHSITFKNDWQSAVNKGNLGLAASFNAKKCEWEVSFDTSAESEKKTVQLTLSAAITLQ